ncbi:hypothetical protein QTA57_10105 [Fontisubflavum oceani]|uniref:hypothetical protein n=1 Tax=Fontisubflavum oceani TaxID=2978973 RepID=UPI0025B4F54C|nr:hypothetical protein [Fontisubflavum oceani]WJY20237.1 hypothetical protein QTA57_10105 [Fontisubflavum oceani]
MRPHRDFFDKTWLGTAIIDRQHQCFDLKAPVAEAVEKAFTNTVQHRHGSFGCRAHERSTLANVGVITVPGFPQNR